MTEPRNYACTDAMKHPSDDYHDRWKNIARNYQDTLNVDLFNNDTQYTPHDYDRHCQNIYNILSVLVPDTSYLNQEEWFLLNVAVILHDVAMPLYFEEPQAREKHSKNAKQYIIQEMSNRRKSSSFLSSNITEKEAETIADIVLGHSDIQTDGNKISTIDLLPMADRRGTLGKNINVRKLAALLRLADELDTNSDRIKFKGNVRSRVKASSEPHWRKCELFDLPIASPTNVSEIQMRLNENRIVADGNLENDIPLIDEVFSKVQNELMYLRDKVFNAISKGLDFHSIVIYVENEEIKSALDKYRAKRTEIVLHNPTEEKAKTSLVSSMRNAEPINSNLSEKIDEWVNINKLYTTGHYRLSNDDNARDWLHTTMLLSTNKYLNEIIKGFEAYLKDLLPKSRDRYLIIGEGFPGVILASALGYKMNIPFTYVIPEKNFKYHTDEEKNISVKLDVEIIIVTDVVVSGGTIEKIKSWLNYNHNVDRVRIIATLTVFHRSPIYISNAGCENSHIQTIPEELVCLNNTYPAEICKKVRCVYRDKCLKNRKHEFES